MANVTIYGKEGCVQCTNAKAYFKVRGVDYDYVDINTNPAAFKLIIAMRVMTLPLIVYEDASPRNIQYDTGYDKKIMDSRMDGMKNVN